MPDEKSLRDKIYSTFSEIASSIGYSPVHGRIIGALLVNGGELSLQDLARETKYSPSMVSLSLDLLEVLGIVKKSKKTGDRNLYVVLQGDLLECLKNAIILKVRKSVKETLKEFEESRKNLSKLPEKERDRVENILKILEKETKRLERYVDILSKIKTPRD